MVGLIFRNSLLMVLFLGVFALSISFASTAGFAQLPDLEITDFRPVSSMVENTQIYFKLNFKNSGGGFVTDPFTVTVVADGTNLIYNITMIPPEGGWDVGASFQNFFDWFSLGTRATKGVHTLVATLDATNAVTESNEANNQKTITIIVDGAGQIGTGTDADGDRFGSQIDCNDNDPKVFPPLDGLSLIGNVTFCPGKYYIPSGMSYTGVGSTLDCNGATLVGRGAFQGGDILSTRQAGASNITIKNCNFEGSGSGIFAIGSDIIAENNTFVNVGGGAGIYYAQASGIIRNNFCTGDRNLNGNCIRLESSTGVNVYGNTGEQGDAVIVFQGASNSNASSNTVRNSARGFYIHSASNSNTITLNNITSNFIGIDLSGANNNVITGNTFSNNSLYDISISPHSDNNQLSGNNFVGDPKIQDLGTGNSLCANGETTRCSSTLCGEGNRTCTNGQFGRCSSAPTSSLTPVRSGVTLNDALFDSVSPLSVNLAEGADLATGSAATAGGANLWHGDVSLFFGTPTGAFLSEVTIQFLTQVGLPLTGDHSGKPLLFAFNFNTLQPISCADATNPNVFTFAALNFLQGIVPAPPFKICLANGNDFNERYELNVRSASSTQATFDISKATLTCPGGVGPIDTDRDGVNDDKDACRTTPGFADRQGCPVGDVNKVELHTIDQASTKTLCPNKAGSCKEPAIGVEVRVFDRNNPQFQAQFTKNPSGTRYPEVFEADIGRVGRCLTDTSGMCTAGEERTGDYLVIAKMRDLPGNKTAYTGKPKSPSDFVNGLATKDFQIIVVRDKTGQISFKAGSKTQITGSMLEIIYPQYSIWQNSNETYPFIFSSAEAWTVDVCLQVPTGYKIVEPAECTQTFVSGESKAVLFQVVETGSPDPNFKTSIKAKDPKGRVTTKSLDIPGKMKAKAAPAAPKAAPSSAGKGPTGGLLSQDTMGIGALLLVIVALNVIIIYFIRNSRKAQDTGFRSLRTDLLAVRDAVLRKRKRR